MPLLELTTTFKGIAGEKFLLMMSANSKSSDGGVKAGTENFKSKGLAAHSEQASQSFTLSSGFRYDCHQALRLPGIDGVITIGIGTANRINQGICTNCWSRPLGRGAGCEGRWPASRLDCLRGWKAPHHNFHWLP